MKFRILLDILDTMRVGLVLGLPAMLRAIFASPALLFNRVELSRISMASIWSTFGKGSDNMASVDKQKPATPHARGVVLDLGAGHGHTLNYLDRAVVTQYIAVEPNRLMHRCIRETAEAAGYIEENGTLLILGCGAEDTAMILSSVRRVETIVSVLALCTVPDAQKALRALVLEVLAPGGGLLFLEHVRNHRADVAWWQKMWTPVWKRVFDGCCLDRPTDIWAKEVVNEDGESLWAQCGTWNPAEFDEDFGESIFWRQVGRFVKK
ncbi:hypothetical protein C8R43DRAFT_906871 [Mycena crocata]|nr:hypothetical protein C8R43DRAFT_906871 [Mycena crocata]